jgi:prepilin-type N-terminal cleavage/methylation domain-containing protein
MRGLTLIEIMTCVAIVLVIANSVLVVQRATTKSAVNQRKALACERQLDIAWSNLLNLTERTEPNFWQINPIRNGFWEAPDHVHGAIHMRNRCPSEANTACITIWDVAPRSYRMPVHMVMGADWPFRIDLEFQPPSTHHTRSLTSTQPGDLLLLKGLGESFCALVESVVDGQVYLAPAQHQPWDLPQTFVWDPSMEAVLIGALSYTHLFLEGDPNGEQRRRLFFRKHQFNGRFWEPQRGRTTATMLLDMRFSSSETLTQIHLFAQPQFPQSLPLPKTIAQQVFHQEVYHAAFTL